MTNKHKLYIVYVMILHVPQHLQTLNVRQLEIAVVSLDVLIRITKLKILLEEIDAINRDIIVKQ